MEALLPSILRPFPILISSVVLWVHSLCDPSSLGSRNVAQRDILCSGCGILYSQHGMIYH
ncbi:unnamed protein product [Sphagnum troendelagicum]|uniref:Uncharacterized protein n=1 Tax=Sphagnum troendelagicum TaxID=128251 RepID=A0ABP0TPK5_9BRYO